jgi:hypothetical protein
MEYLAREAEHHDEGHQRSPGSPDLQVTKVSWQLIPRMDSEPHPRRNLKGPTTSAITIRELQTHQAEGQALATTVKHHYSYISASRRRRALEGYIAIGSLLRLRSGSSLIRATAKVQSLCLIFDSKTNNHHQKCCIDPYTTVVIDKIKPNEGAMISHLFIRFNRRAE